jgi:hypothetical protein
LLRCCTYVSYQHAVLAVALELAPRARHWRAAPQPRRPAAAPAAAHAAKRCSPPLLDGPKALAATPCSPRNAKAGWLQHALSVPADFAAKLGHAPDFCIPAQPQAALVRARTHAPAALARLVSGSFANT